MGMNNTIHFPIFFLCFSLKSDRNHSENYTLRERINTDIPITLIPEVMSKCKYPFFLLLSLIPYPTIKTRANYLGIYKSYQIAIKKKKRGKNFLPPVIVPNLHLTYACIYQHIVNETYPA